MPEHIILKREELYKEVWEKPLIVLAKEFGITDRGLAKICKRHQIPTPGIGYWNKLAAGHKPPQIPLSPLIVKDEYHRDYYEQISIIPTPHAEIIPASNNVTNAIAFEKDLKNSIKFCSSSIYSKPLTQYLMKKLSNAETHDGRLRINAMDKRPILSISKNNLSRALSLLDHLLIAFEARSVKIEFSKESLALNLLVFEEKLTFSILEKIRRTKYQPSSEEEKKYSKADPKGGPRIEYLKWIMSLPRWECHSTGILSLVVNGEFITDLTLLKETNGKKLEEHLNDFFINLYKCTDKIKDCRKSHNEYLKKLEKERREEQDRQLKKEIYKKRTEIAINFFKNWSDIRTAREVLQDMKNFVNKNDVTDEEKLNIQEMINWVENYIKENDPLVKLKEISTDFKNPIKTYFPY